VRDPENQQEQFHCCYRVGSLAQGQVYVGEKKQEAKRLILSRSPFIDSFIQQIVVDSLLCAKHYSWPWK